MSRGTTKSGQVRRSLGEGGFTLVELLVVISIIAVLVALLLPVMSKVTEIVRTTMTRQIIKELGLGLEAFRRDFGYYPPSKPYGSDPTTDPNNLRTGWGNSGGSNLYIYLCGPGNAGWGAAAGGHMPSDHRPDIAPTGTTPTQTYGPYYQTSEDYKAYDTKATSSYTYTSFLDAFHPAGTILYWRYDPSATVIGTGASAIYTYYNVADNDRHTASGSFVSPISRDSNRDVSGVPDVGQYQKVNFFGQKNLNDCVQSMAGPPPKYWRTDYILISPGMDGRYGYTRTCIVATGTFAAGDVGPALKTDISTTNWSTPSVPDDITNWN